MLIWKVYQWRRWDCSDDSKVLMEPWSRFRQAVFACVLIWALHLYHQECDVGSVDFRELQCKAFNDRPLVAGNRYHWMTFHGGQWNVYVSFLWLYLMITDCIDVLSLLLLLTLGSDPCELSCLAIGHNFYYNFGRVLDGTPCQSEQGTVCVNGKCLVSSCSLIHSVFLPP